MLLLVASALAVHFYTPRRLDASWQTQWRFRDWHFGPYETGQPFAFSSVNSYVRPEQTIILVTKGYRFGPLHVFSNSSEPEPQPLGTNRVHVGDILYNPVTKRERFRILATERWHEFDDGTEREGVLVREFASDGEAWLPREKLGKVLVGR